MDDDGQTIFTKIHMDQRLRISREKCVFFSSFCRQFGAYFDVSHAHYLEKMLPRLSNDGDYCCGCYMMLSEIVNWDSQHTIQTELQKSNTRYSGFRLGYHTVDGCEFLQQLAGWWFLHPSEKYDFVNWDDDYSQVISGKMPNSWQPVPTRQ